MHTRTSYSFDIFHTSIMADWMAGVRHQCSYLNSELFGKEYKLQRKCYRLTYYNAECCSTDSWRCPRRLPWHLLRGEQNSYEVTQLRRCHFACHITDLPIVWNSSSEDAVSCSTIQPTRPSASCRAFSTLSKTNYYCAYHALTTLQQVIDATTAMRSPEHKDSVRQILYFQTSSKE